MYGIRIDRRLLVCALVASALVLLTAQSATAEASSPTDEVGRAVLDQLGASRVPAASFAVVQNGHVTTGSIGEDIDADTPFVLGSLSKSFTAMAVLQLVDAGQVELDDPVTRYVPEFTTADGDAITVRHLLNQTSGLPNSAGLAIIDHPDTALADRVAGAAQVQLDSTPGSVFHYSNLNYAVLGMVVEKVSGQSFGDYIQSRLFDQLDMRHSFTSVAAARAAGLPAAHTVWFGVTVAWSTRTTPAGLLTGSWSPPRGTWPPTCPSSSATGRTTVCEFCPISRCS